MMPRVTTVAAAVFLAFVQHLAATTWIPDTGNPVLTPGPDPYDASGASTPCVLYEGGLYKMWYRGYSGSPANTVAYAESANGTEWTKRLSQPHDPSCR